MTGSWLLDVYGRTVEDNAPLVAKYKGLHYPEPFEKWHDDDSFVLWHRMPICEPPYVGTPDCSNWPWREEDEKDLWWTPLPNCNLIHANWEKIKNAK